MAGRVIRPKFQEARQACFERMLALEESAMLLVVVGQEVGNHPLLWRGRPYDLPFADEVFFERIMRRW